MSEKQTVERPAAAHEFNDLFRKTLRGGTLRISAGVNALPAELHAQILRKVLAFEEFAPNDYRHDQGNFELCGLKFFWKIDYYDAAMQFDSDDSADLDKTTPALTIMLASEC